MRNLLLGVFACGALLQAGLVVPNGPWQTISSPVTTGSEKITSVVNADGNSSAYWNNATQDGSTCLNIGCYVTSSGGFAATGAGLSTPVYLGNDNGTSVNNFSFSGTTSGPVQLLLEIANGDDRNWFGWYDTSLSPSLSQFTAANKGTAWDIIFPNTADSGDSVVATIPPGSSFGFWFLPAFGSDDQGFTDAQIAGRLNTGRSLFTEGGKNTGTNAYSQYFALFASSAAAAGTAPATFWMGIEDLSSTTEELNGDFNDMVVKFTVVPEPGFYGALSLGLAGLYLAVRRKKA